MPGDNKRTFKRGIGVSESQIPAVVSPKGSTTLYNEDQSEEMDRERST